MVSLTHLERLEAESIHIMRETVAESERPVMLFSIGKDSAVMLHLARKAFHPSVPPFPLLHVDTTWKFRAMYEAREKMAADSGMELLVHQNPECVRLGINPFDHGSAVHTDSSRLLITMPLMPHSEVPGETRRSRGPKSESSAFGRPSTAGTPSNNDRSCGGPTTCAATTESQ
jgi:hypothetical protein